MGIQFLNIGNDIIKYLYNEFKTKCIHEFYKSDFQFFIVDIYNNNADIPMILKKVFSQKQCTFYRILVERRCFIPFKTY